MKLGFLALFVWFDLGGVSQNGCFTVDKCPSSLLAPMISHVGDSNVINYLAGEINN